MRGPTAGRRPASSKAAYASPPSSPGPASCQRMKHVSRWQSPAIGSRPSSTSAASRNPLMPSTEKVLSTSSSQRPLPALTNGSTGNWASSGSRGKETSSFATTSTTRPAVAIGRRSRATTSTIYPRTKMRRETSPKIIPRSSSASRSNTAPGRNPGSRRVLEQSPQPACSPPYSRSASTSKSLRSTQIVFVSTYCSNASIPLSLPPNPDNFIPPNGVVTSPSP